MGIQPIDLQTMYSQVANVAKIAANAEQGVKLAQGMQLTDIANEVVQKAKAVQQTNAEDKLQSLNQNGSNGGSSAYANKGKKQDNPKSNDEDTAKTPTTRVKESYIGNQLDIMG